MESPLFLSDLLTAHEPLPIPQTDGRARHSVRAVVVHQNALDPGFLVSLFSLFSRVQPFLCVFQKQIQ
jgi:hypothetical protein